MADCSGRDNDALHLRSLSRIELLVRLQSLEAELVELRRRDAGALKDAVHELQVHQVELEMQTREMQEAQGALEESRSRYAELYHHAPTGFITPDRGGCTVEANATVCAMLQRPRARLLKASFAAFVEPASRPAFRRCVAACFEDADEHSVEVLLQGPKGFATAVQVCARRAQGRWGPGEHAHVSLLNVSDRYKLDTQLKFLLSVSDALLGTLDPDVVGAQVVQLAVPLLGEAVSFFSRAHPKRIELANVAPCGHGHRGELLALTRALQGSRLLARATEQRRALAVELDGPAPEGSLVDEAVLRRARQLQLRSLLVLPALSRHEVLGTIVVHQHRDEPRREHLSAFYADYARRVGAALDNAQLYLRSRSESLARRNLLAVVSHDLRNPLSVVMLKGEQLLAACDAATPPSAASVRRRADVVMRCAHRMNELIGDLLDATTIESGTFRVAVAPMRLADIVADAVEAAQGALAAKKLVLRAEVTEDLQVACDRRRTLQVLANILGNATKFTERGGEVTLRVASAGKFAVVSVADTGVGMDEAACARAFDRFWQVQDTAHLGSGLGLSICRGIVEASGGKIWVQTVQGMGSTFSFTLPLVQLALPAAPSPSKEVLLVGGGRGEVAEACSAALASRGLRLTRANDAAQALGSLARQPTPRAVLLELCAPEAGGWDFLARREFDPRLRALPVVGIGRDASVGAHVVASGTTFVTREAVAEDLGAALVRAEASAQTAQATQTRPTDPATPPPPLAEH